MRKEVSQGNQRKGRNECAHTHIRTERNAAHTHRGTQIPTNTEARVHGAKNRNAPPGGTP